MKFCQTCHLLLEFSRKKKWNDCHTASSKVLHLMKTKKAIRKPENEHLKTQNSLLCITNLPSLLGFITYLRLSGQSPDGLKCVAGAEVFCWASELFTATEARSSSVFVMTENGVSRLVSKDFITCAASIASSWGGSSLGGAGGAGSWGSGGSGGKGGGATSGGRGGGCENNWVFPTMELLKLLLNWLFLFFLRFFLFPPPLPNGLKPRPVFLLARLNFTGL